MNQLHNAFAVTTLLLFASASAFADAPVPPALSSGVLECPQADGTVLFTNKEKAGCRTMALKPLSVVPSLDHMPNSPPPPVTEAPASTMTPDRRDRTAPGWAKDWHAGLAQDGSTQDVKVLLRIDTPIEVDYYKHGGILPYVLRDILKAA